MKFFNKKSIIVVVILFLISIGFWLSSINGIFTPFLERIYGETPEAKINAYIQSVARGDKVAALSVLEISTENNSLQERKNKITAELVNAKINSKFKIANIEWWGTCCVPTIINNPKGAGGSRIKVELTDMNNNNYFYIFDVFDRETYYGGATEEPRLRHWVIRDIYKEGDKPLFWTRKSGEI